jgi:hypothetical protein
LSEEAITQGGRPANITRGTGGLNRAAEGPRSCRTKNTVLGGVQFQNANDASVPEFKKSIRRQKISHDKHTQELLRIG